MIENLKKVVCNTIDNRKDDLNHISQEIWKNPELNYEERFAHKLLTTFLEKEGFEVRKSFPLETSFIARYGCKENDCLKIGILCEYDALPNIGHACGHNLIAEAGIGAAIAVKEVLQKDSSIKAEVLVYGTPAEEGGGGKVKMIEQNAFDEADVCMMSHPAPFEIATPIWLARDQVSFVFHGKASHAAAAPWEGINALDAAVACYNSVSMLRQQSKPSNRIHGIIVDGGDKPNIIPQRSEMNYYIRGLLDEDVRELKERVIDCAKGAASATGCTVDVFTKDPFYSAVTTNEILIDLYIKNAKTLNVEFKDAVSDMVASTDMGNVSQIKPSIHPLFKIPTKGANHTHEFTKSTGSQESQLPTLNSAKSMAMTAVDLICNPKLILDVKDKFTK